MKFFPSMNQPFLKPAKLPLLPYSKIKVILGKKKTKTATTMLHLFPQAVKE